MTRTEEKEILRLWETWSASKTLSNQTVTDFFFDVVRRQRNVRHCNVFEVLDYVINSPTQSERQQVTRTRAG